MPKTTTAPSGKTAPGVSSTLMTRNNKSLQIYRLKNPATFSEESWHSMMILNISLIIKPASVFITKTHFLQWFWLYVIRWLSVSLITRAKLHRVFIYLLFGKQDTLRNWKGFFYANISARLFPAWLVFVDLNAPELNSTGKINTHVYSSSADREHTIKLPNWNNPYRLYGWKTNASLQ